MRTLTGIAVMAALALSAGAANAGCADPRLAAKAGAFAPMLASVLQRPALDSVSNNLSAGRNIVGTWHVHYTAGGSPFGEAFIQWHNDGTEWENINFPVLGGNMCMGSWKQIDWRHVSRNHIGWLFTDGLLTGYFTETEVDEVAYDGNSYTGTNDSKIYDLAGHLIVEVPGTASATRIKP